MSVFCLIKLITIKSILGCGDIFYISSSFLIFLIGGAFTVVDETGALRAGVGWLVARLRSREVLMIPVVSVAFAIGGVISNMQEDIIALIPTLLILTSRMGSPHRPRCR